MKKENISNRFNLGTSNGTSVIELVEAAKKITGVDFKVVFDKRRPGDPAILVGSNVKAREILGWEAKYSDMETILESAWDWHRKMEF
jgi:UDP-glucose 4-epimerase